MVRKRIEYDKHHRLPRSRGGKNNHENISVVPRDLHIAWHKLVGNMTAQEAAKMLSDTWIDPDYYLIAVPRKRTVSRRRKRKYCIDCEAEVMKFIPKTHKGE